MKETIKDRLIIFVTGLLLGAVIATGAFFVYSKATSCKIDNNMQMGMPQGNMPSMPNDGQRPERPNDSKSENREMPENSTEQNN